MTARSFRNLARRTDYDALVTTLHDRFARARLVVIEDGFRRAASSSPRRSTSPSQASPRLRPCTDAPVGLLRQRLQDECCEKGLGSPTITLEWTTTTKSSSSTTATRSVSPG
jgi:hypothetical protein